MVAVVMAHLGVLGDQLVLVSLVDLRVPGRILDPGQHALFVDDIEKLARRQPQAELNQVESARSEIPKLAAKSFPFRGRGQVRRIVAPGQDAANDEVPAVEQDLRALGRDLAKAEARARGVEHVTLGISKLDLQPIQIRSADVPEFDAAGPIPASRARLQLDIGPIDLLAIGSQKDEPYGINGLGPPQNGRRDGQPGGPGR